MGLCADQSQEINSLYGHEASSFCPLRIKNSADCMLQWHHNEQHCSPQKQWWGSGSPARCPQFTAHSLLACWRLVSVNHSLLHGDMGRLPLSLNPHLHTFISIGRVITLHHCTILCFYDNALQIICTGVSSWVNVWICGNSPLLSKSHGRLTKKTIGIFF